MNRQEKLNDMAAMFQTWLDHNYLERNKEGLATKDDTYVMTPPSWPSRGVLKAWINALRPEETPKT